MPSTKNPNHTVDPGPGHLSADTVSADALTFDIGSSTSLDVHVVDPSGAHAASAISTLAVSGETWSFPAGDTQGALARAYQGLNARAFWVLDAAGNSDADFKGAGALNQAVTAFGTSTRKPALYLRAGTYTWTHPGNNTALNNVRIVGASGLAIVNATTLAVGASTVLESVVLNASSVTLAGGSATLRRVVINTVTLSNSSAKNVLEDVTVSATGAITLSGLSLSCSGTALTSTSTLTQSGNGASITGGAWAGTTITVSGNDNVFLGVPFTGTTALGGTNNTYLTFGASVGLTVGGTSGAGVAPNFARSDHTHGLPAFGAAANTFCEGNDTRLQDTRPPNGPAGGGLTGTYPNPTVAAVPESVVRTSLAAVTADVSVNGKKLMNVDNPGVAQDAANKSYVDTSISTGLTNVAYKNQANIFTQPQTMGTLTVTSQITSQGYINANADITAGNVIKSTGVGDVITAANGNITARNVTATNGNVTASGSVSANGGNVTASGSVSANGGNVTASGSVSANGGNVSARDDFNYTSSKTRTTFVPIFSSYGSAVFAGGSGFQEDGHGGYHLRFTVIRAEHVFPIVLPQGAVLKGFDVLAWKTGSGTMYAELNKRTNHNFERSGSTVTLDQQSVTKPEFAIFTGPIVVAGTCDVTFDNRAENAVNGAEYLLSVIAGNASDEIHAIRLTWIDPGPRNH